MSWSIFRPSLDRLNPSERVAERISATRWQHLVTKQSRYVIGEFVEDIANSYIVCPRCGSKNKWLTHGKSTRCSCGLHIILYGAGFEIWD